MAACTGDGGMEVSGTGTEEWSTRNQTHCTLDVGRRICKKDMECFITGYLCSTSNINLCILNRKVGLCKDIFFCVFQWRALPGHVEE